MSGEGRVIPATEGTFAPQEQIEPRGTAARWARPGAEDLATRQAALVAALVEATPAPPGFDPVRLEAARQALLRKRAGEAARHWPVLAAHLGSRWLPVFAAVLGGRPPGGGLREGWDVVRALWAGPPGSAGRPSPSRSAGRADDAALGRSGIDGPGSAEDVPEGGSAGAWASPGTLPAGVAAELAAHERRWRYDGRTPPRPRRLRLRLRRA